MKKIAITKCSFFVILTIFCSVGIAQYQSRGIKGGFGMGIVVGQTDMEREIDDSRAGLQGRVFIRSSLFGSGILQGEVGLTCGVLKGRTYKTNLLPIDARLLVSPFHLSKWNPFIYGGIGALSYEAKTRESRQEWTSVVPAGLGLQYLVDDQAVVEISAGYNHVFEDKLDWLSKGSNNDGYMNVTAGLTIGGENLDADYDHDGLSNKLEKELGTNKRMADTDNDGLNDGEEYTRYKTNPLSVDTDGDQLNDRLECQRYETDPLKADSDGDGLTDYDEIRVYKSNPMRPDTDSDGLPDYDEIVKYRTNVLAADSDEDELNDGEEVMTFKTNPLKKDSDADGLSDGKEVRQYSTDPLNADTDGGKVADGVEVGRGTDALDPDDDLFKEARLKEAVGTQVVLEGITFDLNSATIRPSSFATLDRVTRVLLENPDIEVEVHGHTDITGTREYNMRLSSARAQAVCQYLIAKGIAKKRLTAKGFGPDQPVASNNTAGGRAQNRRISFTRTK